MDLHARQHLQPSVVKAHVHQRELGQMRKWGDYLWLCYQLSVWEIFDVRYIQTVEGWKGERIRGSDKKERKVI